MRRKVCSDLSSIPLTAGEPRIFAADSVVQNATGKTGLVHAVLMVCLDTILLILNLPEAILVNHTPILVEARHIDRHGFTADEDLM